MPDTASGRRRRPRHVLAIACQMLAGWLAMSHCGMAQDIRTVEFDPSFLLDGGPTALDLSRFAHGNPVLPGRYDVDIRMNGEWQARKPVRFEARTGQGDASPCLTHDELILFGLAVEARGVPWDDPCGPIGQRIDGATARLDIGEQRLDIEVPQAAMRRQRSGVVPPGQWEQGITSGLLAWRMNVRHAASAERRRASVFAGMDAGANWKTWRWRHAGAWSAARYRGRHTFVERQLETWRSQLRLGDVVLVDSLFPSVRLRGFSIASDARMNEDALGGYAPRVRGIAATHATVKVTQGGVLLRELSVPPGPFVIDDLYAAGRGGYLEVDIEESDGRHQISRVPFFPVPELVREGESTYAFSAGRTAAGHGLSTSLSQASWRRGFAHGATVYGGWRQAAYHLSLLAGVAVDTLAGAFAMDVTRAFAHNGSALLRFRHGRQWRNATLLSVSVSHGRDPSFVDSSRQRGMHAASSRRFDVLVQRQLGGDRGALSASASHAVVTRRENVTLDQALSWSRGWRTATMDVSLRRSRRRDAMGLRTDVSGQFGISMPLGRPASSTNLHATILGESKAGGVRVGISGVADPEGQSTYGLAVGKDRRDGQRFDASVSHAFGVGEVAANVEHAGRMNAGSLSASGGLVIHAGGVTFAPRLGDAAALVHAPGGKGTRVGGSQGVRIDRRGYAVVPYLTPYRWNSVDLDPSGVPLDVAFVSTHRRAAPTAGALVLMPFDTDVSKRLLVTATLGRGDSVPFGAEVVDAAGRSAGIVGQGGRVFLRVDEGVASWTVRWSNEETGHCVLRLSNGKTTAAGDVRHNGVCE